MKKSALAKALAGGAFAAMILAGGIHASAALTDKSGSTGVGIGFSSHTPNPEPGDGDLTLQFIPTSFNFGSDNEIKTGNGVYNEQSGNTYYTVVRDDREEEETGNWKLTASASRLSDVDGSAADVTTAKISFNGAVKEYDGSWDSPSSSTVHDVSGGSTAPTVTENVELVTNGGSADIMTAGATADGGFWVSEMTNIKMTVPGAQVEADVQYSGAVTWTLEDTL